MYLHLPREFKMSNGQRLHEDLQDQRSIINRRQSVKNLHLSKKCTVTVLRHTNKIKIIMLYVQDLM